MRHDEFQIGLPFWCGGKRWRCTDVGTRVIIAISLEPHEIVEIQLSAADRVVRERRSVTEEPSWLRGPPFAVPEQIFDEHDMQGCSLSDDDDASPREVSARR
jgi:hypothetical protein